MKSCRTCDDVIVIDIHGHVVMMCMCDIVLLVYVLSRLKAETFLSHSQLVTGSVANILRHVAMLSLTDFRKSVEAGLDPRLQLISLELIKTNRDGVRKATEAYLIERGQTLNL